MDIECGLGLIQKSRWRFATAYLLFDSNPTKRDAD